MFPKSISHSRHGSGSIALRAAVAALSGSALTLFTGCAAMQSTSATPASAGVKISGSVHGGQQVISGAHIYLFAVNTNATAGQSVDLLTSSSGNGVQIDGSSNGYVTTDANGIFNITGDYTCPQNNPEVYLLSSGGNPGVQPTSDDATPNNTSISMMAALGSCGSLSSSTYITLDEVSTVAAVTALQQFMYDGQHVGATSGNLTGLQNAFATVPNLVDLANSGVRTTNLVGTGKTPNQMIDTLGNVLASCANSVDQVNSGVTTPSQGCSALFSTVTPTGSSAPDNLVSAMLMIAQNPTYNTTNIFNLAPPSGAPYQPALAGAPASYTLGITYTGGGLSYPGAIAIDKDGGAWITSCPDCVNRASGSTPTGGTDAVVAFNAQGSILTGTAGYTTGISKPQSIAIDNNFNIWTTNQGTTPSVQVFTNENTPVSNFPYTTGLQSPEQVAIDATGNGYVTDAGTNSVLHISSSASELGNATMSGFTQPLGLAIDNNGDVYAAGTGSSNILEISGITNTLLTGNGLNAPIGLGIGANSTVWAVNNASGSAEDVSEFTSGGAAATGSPFTNLGLAQAATITLDGAGNVFIPNCQAGCSGSGSTTPDSIVELNSQGTVVTGTSGIQDPNFAGVGVSAIDGSGNLWVTNNGGNSVTEILGVAVPVQTPVAAAVSMGIVGLPAGTPATTPSIRKAAVK